MPIRSVIGSVTAVAMLAAQLQATPSFAQSTASLRVQQAAISNAAVAEAFAQYPQGGDLLAKRIADLIVADPDRASYMVKYVRTAGISYAQKVAAERGLAMALERLGVKAADMPVPPPPAYDYTWLALGLAALVGTGIGCAVDFCRHHGGGGSSGQ
jgi:hypothetical protein